MWNVFWNEWAICLSFSTWASILCENPCNFFDKPFNDEDEGAKSFLASDDEIVEEAYVPMPNNDAMSLVRNDVELDMVDVDLVPQQLQCHKKKGKIQVANASSESGPSEEEDMPLVADETDN